MAAAKTPRAQAARGEAGEETRTIQFEGVTLDLPPQLPGSFAFDYATLIDLQESEDSPIGALRRLIVSIITEPKWEEIREAAPPTDDASAAVNLLWQLIADILATYGTDSGE